MSSIDYRLVGEKIKSLRKQAGLTQEKMAEMCDISTSFLGHIERGSRNLSLETAVKFADCLNVSLDSLIIGGKGTEDNIFSMVVAIADKQDGEKKAQFVRIVKLLADNIDKL